MEAENPFGYSFESIRLSNWSPCFAAVKTPTKSICRCTLISVKLWSDELGLSLIYYRYLLD